MTNNLRRVKELFVAALDIPAGEARNDFLQQACADVELRQQVDVLLAAHDVPVSALDKPLAGEAAPLNPTIAGERPPQNLMGTVVAGRYKLLEQIGEGGMGTVWMAQQKEPVKRKVAIKLVKAGMDSVQVLARFEAERQALALMDHPNIAKVFDGGLAEQGRPYFVMEFVKGVPLTYYCDQARLSLKERLNLFIPVCQAVQHAHLKGIIHRDLKPSNVLICLYDGRPVPKVIDFGLAKALHHSLTEQTLHTAFGTMVGTPLYMSPEQAEHNNLDVDIRTDIYSLGVILYELLTGSTPLESQQLKVAAYNEILRLIKDVEPPKPSTRLSGSASLPSIAAQRSIDPKQLSKSLSGDLDWIVMKTLEKDRSRRYETVSALVNEIHRYLDGQPVEACPPSTAYRLRKFASRHRTWIVVAAAFLFLIMSSSVLSWILLARAQVARNLALAAQASSQKERDRALGAERIAANHLLTATREKERADTHARELKQRLYEYNITKAYSAYRDDQLTTTARFLAECLPEQRGWEWSFISRLSKAAHSISLPTNSTVCFVVGPDVKRFFTVDQEGMVRSVGMLDGRVQWSQKSEIALSAQCILSPAGDRLLLVGSRAPANSGDSNPVTAVIQLLDSRDGKPLWTERPTAVSVYEPAFSSDGTRFLISTVKLPEKTTSIQLRSSSTGQLSWSLPAGTIAQAVFDKTGAKVFVAETNAERIAGPSTIRCVRAVDNKELWLSTRAQEASGIMLSPEGTELAATGENHSLVVFDAATGAQKARHKGPLQESGFLVRGSAVQDLVLTISQTGRCVVWDWKSKRPIDESRVVSDASSIQLTPDGEQIAFMSAPAGTLQMRPTLTLPDELTLLGHGSGFKGARFLDNDQLCSVGNERALRVWKTHTGQELKATSIAASGLELDISRNGKWIATATTKGTELWDRETGTLLQDWLQDGQTWFAKFDAAGNTLATAGQQGICRVYKAHDRDTADRDQRWSTPIARPLHEFKASASIHGLAISTDGSTIYTLDSPGCEVLAWNAETGEHRVLRASQAGQTGRTAELSPDGQFLAIGVDRSVEIVDVKSKKLVARLRGPERNILSLTFDRTGSRLFAGTANGVITLWNVRSQEMFLSIQAHSSYVVCLAMSPDNSTLASTSFGGELKLWEARTLTPATARQRIDVQRATEHANRLLIQHKTPLKALEELAKDGSVSTQIIPTVTAVLQARMEAPVNLQALVSGNGKVVEKSLDSVYKQRTAAASLKERIEVAIGQDLAALQSPTMNAPDHIVAARWNTLSRNLLLKSRFNLELKEIIPLLAQLTESDDAPHYLVYLKAIAHVNLSEWQTAESELSRAIGLVPPKSPMWFEYAFRLAFLRGYVGKWDAYNELCAEALDGFSESTDSVILERAAKMCLFSNQSTIDAQEAGKVADRASGLTVGGFSTYTQLTGGIAHLRRKNYQESLNSLNAVMKSGVPNSKDGNAIIVALAKVYAAIACQHLGRPQEAQQHLEESANAIRSFPPGTGWWPDWMMSVVVLKEAEDLIDQDKEKSPAAR